MTQTRVLLTLLLASLITACGGSSSDNDADLQNKSQSSPLEVSNIQVGPRPYFLIADLATSDLKTALESCSEMPFKKTDFSIGHRGAAMQFPEHTKESYMAAARMGAGILECDVTFTNDKELVCRHSQCDLHTTTNILATDLADKCSIPFTPSDGTNPATAQCCTSDISLAQFKTLTGKMDGANPAATTVAEYLKGTADFRTDGYASRGTLMTHKESIELFKQLNVKMTPELKSAAVAMPFDGFSQQDYARKMLSEYQQADVPAENVFAQSFNRDDVLFWLAENPSFGEQAVFLDERMDDPSFEVSADDMNRLFANGVRYVAPPMWALVELDSDNNLIQSEYAVQAKAAGLKIITWTLERSGPLSNHGGWYYQTTTAATNTDSDMLVLLDFLAQTVKVEGVFSDWAGTVSYYASCMNLK
ncbi:MAG: glycerophosphodiester phosphodiesterase [Oleispira sp.]|nr:glycerophosphodiester phosphodiesterase [Oleispira sp.]MBL4882008.1 glycerophosphodiester phosphodiesterase [Oleispira sp.]